MGLPNPLGSLLGNNKKKRDIFLSLLLYPDAVDAAAWEIGPTGKAIVLGAVTQAFSDDTWEARGEASDKCVTALEQLTKTTDFEKVILGLPGMYLTPEGDIVKAIRPHIKTLTRDLGLTPIGFVSLYQSLVHKYKKEEGVPPSMILLGVTGGMATVTLYKVGTLLYQETFPVGAGLGQKLEESLTHLANVEVLPSRILLYGTRIPFLEQIKRELLHHKWGGNKFLHQPKVEILAGDTASIAVSYAGAAELTHTIDIEEEMEEEEIQEKLPKETSGDILDEEGEVGEVEEEEKDFDEEEAPVYQEHANVIPATVEQLGFRPHIVPLGEKEPSSSVLEKKKRRAFPTFAFIPSFLVRITNRRHTHDTGESASARPPVSRLIILLGIPLILIVAGIYMLTTVLPKAVVAITVTPKMLDKNQTVLVAADATDVSENQIPGTKQEQKVSGEKSVPATGKKTVGDPAKGTVTVFNKSTVARKFPKGTLLSVGSINFTLDDDVSVASASEDFNGITYTKATANVTANDIGVQGNVSAAKEFTIAGVSTNVAVARNEKAFTGGNSKDIVVVSRADQDTIVKQLTQDLTDQAKQQFEQQAQGLTIIPQTMKTTVTEKTFSQEVGQEAKEVSGKVTVTISGTAYKTDDITKLFNSLFFHDVPQGFKLAENQTKVSAAAARIDKSGTIKLDATASGTFLPQLDTTDLSKKLAGKSVSDARKIIESFPGISSVKITVSSTLTKNKLPVQPSRIKITIEK